MPWQRGLTRHEMSEIAPPPSRKKLKNIFRTWGLWQCVKIPYNFQDLWFLFPKERRHLLIYFFWTTGGHLLPPAESEYFWCMPPFLRIDYNNNFYLFSPLQAVFFFFVFDNFLWVPCGTPRGHYPQEQLAKFDPEEKKSRNFFKPGI